MKLIPYRERTELRKTTIEMREPRGVGGVVVVVTEMKESGLKSSVFQRVFLVLS